MRRIYTMLLALVAVMAAFAQAPENAPDPSQWTAKQNVAKELGMGDVDPSEPWTMESNGGNGGTAIEKPGDFGQYWKGEGQIYFTDYADKNRSDYNDEEKEKVNSCMGFYADDDQYDLEDPYRRLPEMYQVVWIPKGYYTIRAQAVYRDGPGAKVDDLIKNYLADKTYSKNAWMYANVLTGQDPESDVVTEFKIPVCHIGASTVKEQQLGRYNDWHDDGSFDAPDYVDGWNGTTFDQATFYFPKSILGAGLHFHAGNYWNEIKLCLLEGAWVRIGVRKTAGVGQDWLACSEWQIIYNSEVNDEAVKTLFDAELATLDAKKKEIANEKFKGFDAAFANSISKYMEQESDKATKAWKRAGSLEEKINLYLERQQRNLYYDDVLEMARQLSLILEKSVALQGTTEYSGLATFTANISGIQDRLKNTLYKDFGTSGGKVEPLEYCENVFKEVANIRGQYLDTQEADEETGAKDFSAVINHPWFVNDDIKPEYVENDGDGRWVMKQMNADTGDWEEISVTSDNLSTVASDVKLVLNSTEVRNQWFEEQAAKGGRSESFALTANNGYACAADTWHDNAFTAGYMAMNQMVMGLPAGWYSLEAYVRTQSANNGTPHLYNNIYMRNSLGVEESSLSDFTVDTSWQLHQTGIIEVPADTDDPTLLIGGRSDGCAYYTGFRLLFYGVDPPMDKIIAQQLETVKKAEAKLTDEEGNFEEFEGDRIHIQEILDQIKFPVADKATFDAYRQYLADAIKYINEALAAYKNNKTNDIYDGLAMTYIDYDDTESIIEKPWEEANALGSAEKDTYLDIDNSVKLANKYSDYMKVYKQAYDCQNAEIQGVLNEQVAELSAAAQDTTTLKAYISRLKPLINIDQMSKLGAADATSERPVDLSSMIVNPTFELEESNGEIQPNDAWERGHASYGWKHEGSGNAQSNEYSRGNYEVWNSGSSGFTFYQKLTKMPGGTYKLSCKAVYRDAAAVSEELVKLYEQAGNEKAWEHNYAQLYAKSATAEEFVPIKAVESLKGRDFSFKDVVYAYSLDNGTPYATTLEILGTADDWAQYYYDKYNTDENTLSFRSVYQDEEGQWGRKSGSDDWASKSDGTYPFDTEVEVDGVPYYFPSSMYGFYVWCQNDPEAVYNEVEITIQNGETLEIGLRKANGESGDWVIFDDFKLEYLSGDVFQDETTGIEDVTPAESNSNALYNTAGQIVDESYKGIVIDGATGKKFIQ